MISKDEIRKLSVLARIEVDKKEIKSLQGDMENILGFVSKLKEFSMPEELGKEEATNKMREDKDPHESGKHTEDLLNQAPELKEGFVKVKKVL